MFVKWVHNLTKNSYSKIKNQSKMYNQNLSFGCGDYLLRLSLQGPSHRSEGGQKILMRTFKTVTFMCIQQKNMYKKGSKYQRCPLNLNQLNKLLQFKINEGNQLTFQNQQSIMKLKVVKAKQKKTPPKKTTKLQKQQQQQEQQKPENPQQKSKAQVQQLAINIALKSEIGQAKFQIQNKQFSLIQNFLYEFTPIFYGIHSAYEIQLNRLIYQFENDVIPVQMSEQDEEKNFRL